MAPGPATRQPLRLQSLFRFEAEDVEAVYGGRDRLRSGLETLLAVLSW